jgi:cyclopropane fatty-acyl-phospholipid synthase-like methyltransferase
MKVKRIVKDLLKKIVNPKILIRLIKIRRDKKKNKNKIYVDTYLKTYSTILSSESLHFPYFSDPDIHPEDISFSDLANGGLRYANHVIDKIVDKKAPVLDVGCGLGELCKLLFSEGYKTIGLTPDDFQYNYIREKHPEIEIIKSKLETMDYRSYKNHFGTIITAESLQYLKLDKAFPIIDNILMPSGHWIVCDYFKTMEKTSLKHQHFWDKFENMIHEMRWEIISQQNITQNVLPFLAFCHMLGNKFIFSIIDFFTYDLQKRKPGAHFLLEDTINSVKADITKRLRYIDPEVFAQERKYMLLVIKKN